MKPRTMFEAIPVGPETNPKESGTYLTDLGLQTFRNDLKDEGYDDFWVNGTGKIFPKFWLLDHNQTREEIQREAWTDGYEEGIEQGKGNDSERTFSDFRKDWKAKQQEGK